MHACITQHRLLVLVWYLLVVILRDVAEKLTRLPEQDILLAELFL